MQGRWQFPSDHLPIGMSLGKFHIASWNVLDSDYIDLWVTEKDSQGLKGSMISDEHVLIGDSKLTLRDKHVVDLIFQMLFHPTHPRAILSLQECNAPFLEELRSRLPAHFGVYATQGEAVLFDQKQVELLAATEVAGVFNDNPKRTFQDLTFRLLGNGTEIRIVNAHMPGDPKKPSRFEFARYLSETHGSLKTTIALGDMNFNELEMADAMGRAFEERSPFSIYSPYCTNISPLVYQSKAIDHFLVHAPGLEVRVSDPEEVLSGLTKTVSLLEPVD